MSSRSGMRGGCGTVVEAAASLVLASLFRLLQGVTLSVTPSRGHQVRTYQQLLVCCIRVAEI
jgi:hypothetical protein